jgi:FtsZ-binding cell division protein ZapB
LSGEGCGGEASALREHIESLKAEIADLKQDRDRWRDQVLTALLPGPARRWWRR